MLGFWTTILYWAYEKACTERLFVVRSVVEQVLFGLARGNVMDDILDKHIANYVDTNYVDTGEAAEKIDGKLLSTNSFIVKLARFIEPKTGKAIATESVTTEMKKSWRHTY